MNTPSSFESFVKANGGPLYHQFLDARGLFCPEPLMLIRKNLRLMAESEILLVLCDDPTAVRDVPNFCHFIGHQLLKMDQQLSELAFWIQKNDPIPPAF